MCFESRDKGWWIRSVMLSRSFKRVWKWWWNTNFSSGEIQRFYGIICISNSYDNTPSEMFWLYIMYIGHMCFTYNWKLEHDINCDIAIIPWSSVGWKVLWQMLWYPFSFHHVMDMLTIALIFNRCPVFTWDATLVDKRNWTLK